MPPFCAAPRQQGPRSAPSRPPSHRQPLIRWGRQPRFLAAGALAILASSAGIGADQGIEFVIIDDHLPCTEDFIGLGAAPPESVSSLFGTTVLSAPGDGVDEGWSWSFSNPTPRAGSFLCHTSGPTAGLHQHWFISPIMSPEQADVPAAAELYAYVYLDPANPPQEVILQWHTETQLQSLVYPWGQTTVSSWEHRAWWGNADLVPFGSPGTSSQVHVGGLPPTGQWVRLEVPAAEVDITDSGLANAQTAVGQTQLDGLAFTLYDGKASFCDAGWIEINAPGMGGVNPGTVTPATVPLYRFYQPSHGIHFYTTDPYAPDGYALPVGSSYEGVQCHLLQTRQTDSLTMLRYTLNTGGGVYPYPPNDGPWGSYLTLNPRDLAPMAAYLRGQGGAFGVQLGANGNVLLGAPSLLPGSPPAPIIAGLLGLGSFGYVDFNTANASGTFGQYDIGGWAGGTKDGYLAMDDYDLFNAYAYPDPQPGTVPLYEYYNTVDGDHFYTTSFAELGGGGVGGYVFAGVMAWVLP